MRTARARVYGEGCCTPRRVPEHVLKPEHPMDGKATVVIEGKYCLGNVLWAKQSHATVGWAIYSHLKAKRPAHQVFIAQGVGPRVWLGAQEAVAEGGGYGLCGLRA
jgi:hypothetical protein